MTNLYNKVWVCIAEAQSSTFFQGKPKLKEKNKLDGTEGKGEIKNAVDKVLAKKPKGSDPSSRMFITPSGIENKEPPKTANKPPKAKNKSVKPKAVSTHTKAEGKVFNAVAARVMDTAESQIWFEMFSEYKSNLKSALERKQQVHKIGLVPLNKNSDVSKKAKIVSANAANHVKLPVEKLSNKAIKTILWSEMSRKYAQLKNQSSNAVNLAPAGKKNNVSGKSIEAKTTAAKIKSIGTKIGKDAASSTGKTTTLGEVSEKSGRQSRRERYKERERARKIAADNKCEATAVSGKTNASLVGKPVHAPVVVVNQTNKISVPKVKSNLLQMNTKKNANKTYTEAQIKQIRKARRAQRQAEDDKKWQALCSSHKQLMARAPGARCSVMEDRVYQAVFNQAIRYLGDGSAEYFRLSDDNFGRPLELLLHAEEAWEHTEMRNYDLRGVRVSERGSYQEKTLYQFRTNIMNHAGLRIIPTDNVVLFDGSQAHVMTIHDIDGDLVVCCFKTKKSQVALKDAKYDVSFVQSGLSTKRFLKAVQQVDEDERFKNALYGVIPSVCRVSAKIDFGSTGTSELDHRFAKLNDPQKKAIINILEAKCRPNLYVLFGPPGTGKTFTLVESVVQIYHRNPSARVLVCSSSNTCVDSIALSIFDTRQVRSMRRLCSKHHFNRCVNRREYFCLEPTDLKSCRVVVATNVISAKIMTQFDYILVDEAGHAHVPETLIPLTKLRRDGLFVLAGDPRQLGPVIKSFEVERLGLGASLLERMCDLDTYARVEGQYNERYITKLINSYRCDPRILGICNKLFYHGDLNCLGKTPPSVLRMFGVERPLLFAKVNGKESHKSHSHSRCNAPEAYLCIKLLMNLYKMGFEANQIGIITPYNLQKDTLTKEMHKQLRKEAPILNERFRMPRKEKPTAAQPMKGFQFPVLPQTHSLNAEDLHRNDVDFVTDGLRMLRLQAEQTKNKLKEVKKMANAEQAPKMDWFCKIDTVDAFQGGEREVIIVSTVRTPDQFGDIDQCGFLADAKRFNVTISRAKWLVFVVGHPAVLECCNYWEEFGRESARIGVKSN